MNFAFTPEQIALRDLAREFLGREAPFPKLRRAIETERGYDERLWRQLGELGLLGLAIPEEFGGQGLGMVELCLLLEEMGRHACAGPCFATTVLAAGLIDAAASDEQRRRWLPAIAAGRLVATVALEERDLHPRLEMLTTEFSRGRVSGTKWHVPHAAAADWIFVVGRGGTIAAVERGAAGLTIEALPTMDPTQREARVRFDDVRGEPLPGGPDAVAAMLRRAASASSAEMLGAARRSMEMSVAYAGTREQFGQPIGQFQAVKHMCAEMLDEVEHSHAATYYAAWAFDAGAPDADLAASVAKSFVSHSARKVCGDAIQVHGGIGFTWEFDLHFLFKRAKHHEPRWGDADHHRERVLELTLAARTAELEPAHV